MSMDVTRLLEQNRAWADARVAADPDYFARHLEGQSPAVLYIGCSDSRVPPEQMMGVGPGEVFVYRNVANIVSTADPAGRAVISFGVGDLRVDDIVVCGHYGCGGVIASGQRLDSGPLDRWLDPIRAVARDHAGELASLDGQAALDKLVELNARRQARALLQVEEVAGAVADRGLRIHAWVFGLADGRIRDLGFRADEADGGR